MNIYAVDEDPVAAARSLCDVHTTSQTGEAAQVLSASALCMGYDEAPYNPFSSKNNRFIRWVMAARGNWDWLVAHGVELARQHMARRGTQHKAFIAIAWARSLDPYEHYYDMDPAMTPFVMAVYPPVSKSRFPQPSSAIAVDLYREYYRTKEVEWAKRAHRRMLLTAVDGAPTKGSLPVMTWSGPSERPEWMPDEQPVWRPTLEEYTTADDDPPNDLEAGEVAV